MECGCGQHSMVDESAIETVFNGQATVKQRNLGSM